MNILFLCVANSARSQMAEGLAKKMLGREIVVSSAGSHPAQQVHALAIAVMNEVGIDIDLHRPKSIDSLGKLFLQNVDWVITLCADEVCPTGIGKQRLHWGLPDPASECESKALDAFRKTRDQIQERLEVFTRNLFKIPNACQ